MYGGIFICVYICRLFPLPEDFLRVDQTVDHYVPVDTDSVIHNMRIKLTYQLLIEGETHEVERAKRFELSTFSLATRCSTTELRPLVNLIGIYHCNLY